MFSFFFLFVSIITPTLWNLEGFHFKSGSNLIKLYGFIVWFCIGMMSEWNSIAIIWESNNSFRIILGNWEQMLQDFGNSFSQLGRKAIEDQMGISLTHGIGFILQIMSKHSIREPEMNGRSMGQMRDNHAIWLTSMLMKDDQVCEVLSDAEID